jgi:hypothetical protein
MSAHQVIFVLGMHRSGTSALSGGLASAGVWFGDDLLGPETGVNDKGFWEHRELVRINEALLHAHGLHWYTPRLAERLIPLLQQPEQAGELWQSALDWAQGLLSGRACVAIKDPRLCVLAPFWQAVFERLGAKVSAVHLLRHPAEVQSSLFRRDAIQPDHANALWLEYVLNAAVFCHRLSDSHTTSYDLLMQAPNASVRATLEACGIQAMIDAGRLSDWIEPGLRHHKGLAVGVMGDLGLLVDSLYHQLLAGVLSARQMAQAEAILSSVTGWVDQLEAQFTLFNRTVKDLQCRQQQLDTLGHAHQRSLQVIDERDQQIDQLGKAHTQAQQVVALRDRQLSECQQQLQQLGDHHSHALSVIAERDQQCEHYLSTVVQLQALVDQLQTERDTSQAELHQLQRSTSRWPIRMLMRVFKDRSH